MEAEYEELSHYQILKMKVQTGYNNISEVEVLSKTKTEI